MPSILALNMQRQGLAWVRGWPDIYSNKNQSIERGAWAQVIVSVLMESVSAHCKMRSLSGFVTCLGDCSASLWNSSSPWFCLFNLWLKFSLYWFALQFAGWCDLLMTADCSFVSHLLSIDLVALLQKPVPPTQASEANSFETSQQQGFGQALVFTNSQHSNQTAPGTGSSTSANAYSPHSLVTHFYFKLGLQECTR